MFARIWKAASVGGSLDFLAKSGAAVVAVLAAGFAQFPLGLRIALSVSVFLFMATLLTMVLPRVLPAGDSADASTELARQEAAREHYRDVRRAAHRITNELSYIGGVIREHVDRGIYWDPKKRTLVADEWAANRDILAGEPAFDQALKEVRFAYNQIDRINHRVELRASQPPSNVDHMRIEDESQDNLAVVLGAISSAEGSLLKAVRQWAPPTSFEQGSASP